MTQADDKAFQSRMQQLEEALQRVQAIADPAARDLTGQIIQTLMEYHGAGLSAIMERVAGTGEGGHRLIGEFAEDDLIGSLLLLYGLHPLDMAARVRQGLEKARPYLKSHGGNVELLGISEAGVVRLRLEGSCHGCPSSAATLKNSIEQAIYDKAPDVAGIEVENDESVAVHGHSSAAATGNGFLPATQLTISTGKRHRPESFTGATHVTTQST